MEVWTAIAGYTKSISSDSNGSLYLVHSPSAYAPNEFRLKRITKEGQIRATNIPIAPRGLAFNNHGILFISSETKIFKISNDENASVFAGNGIHYVRLTSRYKRKYKWHWSKCFI